MALQHQELKADARLREALGENADLRLELARLETQTNLLQGYGLDDTSAEDLSKLIESLTQVRQRKCSMWACSPEHQARWSLR